MQARSVVRIVALMGLAVGWFLPRAASAQSTRVIHVVDDSLAPVAGAQGHASDSSRGPTLVPRAWLGTAGAVGGAFAGAVLGVAVLGADCGCDDPGLPQALLGATVGSVVGAAAVSAIPELGSRCHYAGRFGRALIGAAIGALLGGLASGGSEMILVTYPVGAGVGAGVGANRC